MKNKKKYIYSDKIYLNLRKKIFLNNVWNEKYWETKIIIKNIKMKNRF